MARYMETAADANKVALQLLDLITDPELKPTAAAMIAKLVNLGFRCNPRAAHGTIRLNAVQRAVRDLPVKVHMEQVPKRSGVGTFNALAVVPVGGEKETEGTSDEE